jgi:hypothetical protein
MQRQQPSCAILADRHTSLMEGIRGLLETEFDAIYAVADVQSLSSGAQRLLPDLIIVDLSLVVAICGLMQRVPTCRRRPRGRASVHDPPCPGTGCRRARRSPQRCVGTDFVPAIDMCWPAYVSPAFGVTATAA